MTFENNIENIINNDNFSVVEKRQELDKLLEEFKTKITIIKKEITEGYMFCPKCGDYYKKSAWEAGARTIIRKRCTNLLTGGYLDDYEYEDIEETELYHECPKGHKVIDYYGC